MALLNNVTVNQLKPKMKIVAFTRFLHAYTNMEEKVCRFVQHNLKGVTVEILRENITMTCPVDQIQIGDSLSKIFDIPASLNKFTNVSKGLIPELKKRGFLEFTVRFKEPALNGKQEKRQKSVFKANEFMQKIKAGVKVRKFGIDAAKSMINSARKGKPSVKEVKNNIDKIMNNTSPEALAAVAFLQSSDQTYAHCIDAAAIFQNAYFAMKRLKNEKSIFRDEKWAMFAAFTHDFGKAKVPIEILESTVRFDRDSFEMQQLQNHPVFGYELLSSMNMPQSIVDMAHYHHVKMDTQLNSSYPKEVNYDDVIMEARLVAIVDVYQALIGRRSYKKSWAPAEAIRYIDTLAGTEFDPEIWDDFVSVVGMYPKGSLVELSDGTIGFVMSVPTEDLERPEVVVFRDANGAEYDRPTLIDLEEIQDLEIKQDLDQYEVLGDNAMDIFLQLEIE